MMVYYLNVRNVHTHAECFGADHYQFFIGFEAIIGIILLFSAQGAIIRNRDFLNLVHDVSDVPGIRRIDNRLQVIFIGGLDKFDGLLCLILPIARFK